jgi:metastasis suppressor protein 1
MTFSLFLDAFQRIADLATNTKGATREIGTGLTRLILRHKSIEQKLKSLTNALLDTFIQPLNERIDDWKKSTSTLDKDHAKGLKGKFIVVIANDDDQTFDIDRTYVH